MKYELRTVGVWPLIKISFFLNGIMGFIIGLLYALFMGFIISVASSVPFSQGQFEELRGLSFGWLVVFIPIVSAIAMAIIYTIVTVIAAAIYNLLARAIGGLEFEFNPVEPEPAKAPVTAYTSAGYPGQQPSAPSPSRFAPPPPPPPPHRETPPPPPPPEQPPPPPPERPPAPGEQPPPPPPEEPKPGENDDNQKPEG